MSCPNRFVQLASILQLISHKSAVYGVVWLQFDVVFSASMHWLLLVLRSSTMTMQPSIDVQRIDRLVVGQVLDMLMMRQTLLCLVHNFFFFPLAMVFVLNLMRFTLIMFDFSSLISDFIHHHQYNKEKPMPEWGRKNTQKEHKNTRTRKGKKKREPRTKRKLPKSKRSFVIGIMF